MTDSMPLVARTGRLGCGCTQLATSSSACSTCTTSPVSCRGQTQRIQATAHMAQFRVQVLGHVVVRLQNLRHLPRLLQGAATKKSVEGCRTVMAFSPELNSPHPPCSTCTTSCISSRGGDNSLNVYVAS